MAGCLSALLPAQFGKGEENEAIAKAVVSVKPTEAGKTLTNIFEKHTKSACAACLDLWSCAANLVADDSAPAWLRQSLEIVLEHLPKARGNKAKAPSTRDRSRYWSRSYGDSFDFDADEEDAPNKSRVPKLDVDTLASWLLLVDECCPARHGNQAIEALCTNTGGFPPDTLLAPCIIELQRADFPSKQLDRLWHHCCRFLARRSPRPPASPKDWKQPTPAQWKCNCKDCGVLRPFVSDPGKQVLRLPIAKARRMHIHRVIDDNGLDMTHATERKGSPYTLVCTKTRTAYEKKCKRHVADVMVMKQLEKLSELAASPAAIEALEKIRKAIKAAVSKSATKQRKGS